MRILAAPLGALVLSISSAEAQVACFAEMALYAAAKSDVLSESRLKLLTCLSRAEAEANDLIETGSEAPSGEIFVLRDARPIAFGISNDDLSDGDGFIGGWPQTGVDGAVYSCNCEGWSNFRQRMLTQGQFMATPPAGATATRPVTGTLMQVTPTPLPEQN